VLLVLAYVALPAVIGLAWVLEQDLLMRRAVLLGGCLCFAFYALFPAVGPGQFDWVRQVPTPYAPDNCMPSMHLTWALLIAINARSLKLRVGLWIYAAVMVVATLALKEHYLIDLIAAVPYTFAVQWMARHCERYLPLVRRASPQSG
jgi:membrane-associated phospholipid phosphatase